MNSDTKDKSKPTSTNNVDDVSLLEEILSRASCESRPLAAETNSAAALERHLPALGLCIDTQHPTLIGRALVRADLDGVEKEQWMPALAGISLRPMDRVMVQIPRGGIEPIVIGVVDGFKKRPETERSNGPALPLLPDESVKVTDEQGTALLEVFKGKTGPTVRLLHKDLHIDIPGRLRLSAKSICLEAEDGDAEISASRHTIVKGEMIRLN